MRVLKVKATQRNLDRVHKWLRLESDWGGWFLRDGGRVGYKTGDYGHTMYFNFI